MWFEFAEWVFPGVRWGDRVPGGLALCLYVYAVACEARMIKGVF